MRIHIKIGSIVLRIITGITISFFFFVFISILHSLIGLEKNTKSESVKQMKIIAEIVKKTEPPKKQQTHQRIRSVQNAQAGMKSGTSQPAMKFQPDLASAEGGEGVEVKNDDVNAEIFEEGQTDEVAQEEYLPPVEYPDKARELGAEGIVKVRFTITYEGKATDIEIISTPHVVLSTEVRKVLLNSRFKPAKNKGVPVNVRMSKDFEFSLE